MYKFKIGDQVHTSLGNGVIVAKNGFQDILQKLYAVQRNEFVPDDFSSVGIAIVQEHSITMLPVKCPTCGK